MCSTAIICVFFISANNICLHHIIKINKLLHKLNRMIHFITKSSSQLNPPLFSVFLTSPTCWLFILFSSPLCSLLLSPHAGQIAAIVYGLLHQVVRLFSFSVVVALLQHSGVPSMCRQSIIAVAMEYALGCLVLLSNCHHYIHFISKDCRVIWSFGYCCFIAAFWYPVYVNVS